MPLPPVLPLLPDWYAGIREQRAFRTSILSADDGSEQRAQTRARARRRLTFPALTLRELETQTTLTLLQRIHEDAFALPWWMHRAYLDADAGAGAGSLALDTTGLDFLVGNYALLWRSPTIYELVQISAVAAGSLTLDAGTPTTLDWNAGDYIMPAFPARLAAPLTVTRTGSRGLATAIDALVEPLTVPVAAGAPGDDPADFLWMPDAVGDEVESWQRLLDVQDGELGPIASLPFTAAPAVTFPLTLGLRSRAAVADFWTWYDAVLGALTPSWVPNWQAALRLASAATAADNTLTIKAVNYTDRWFPDESRRHLALIASPSSIVHRRVTNAVDNLDGTETLTLDAVTGVALSPSYSLVALMHYARLADDPVTVVWDGPEHASVDLRFTELPVEEPASV